MEEAILQSHEVAIREVAKKVRESGPLTIRVLGHHRSGPTVLRRGDFGTSVIGNLEHGGNYPPKSRSHDTRSREKRERIWTVGYTGIRHRRSGPIVLMREGFGTSAIGSPEYGGNNPPRSRNRDTRSLEKSENHEKHCNLVTNSSTFRC
jgi:hypothetical protein